MPLPSSTLGISGIYEGTTNSLGNALITIAPPGLPGQNYNMMNISYNNHAGLNGNAAIGANYFVKNLPSNSSAANIQKYRLVSSLARITYVGPVLDTSGRFQSCVTLDPFGIVYQVPNETDAQVLADRFGDFSLIRNGYWNRSVDIAQSNSMEFLYIPVDKNSTVFETKGSYGGTTANDGVIAIPKEQFTKMSHIIAAIGLPPNAKLIIEQFANYELLIDPSAVAYFGPSIDNPISNKDLEIVHEQISNDPNKLVRTTKKNESTSFMDVLLKIGEIAGPVIAALL
jgi:hypothetical protein